MAAHDHVSSSQDPMEEEKVEVIDLSDTVQVYSSSVWIPQGKWLNILHLTNSKTSLALVAFHNLLNLGNQISTLPYHMVPGMTLPVESYCLCDIEDKLQVPAPLNSVLDCHPNLSLRFMLRPPHKMAEFETRQIS